MKLKKAVRKARRMGFNWIAVDENRLICGFVEEPEILGEVWDTTGNFSGIGRYKGTKDWKDSLRAVHPEAVDVKYDPQEDIVQKDRDEFMHAWEFGLNRLDDMKTEFRERAQADEAQIPEDWKLPKGNGGSTPEQYGIPEGSKDLQDLIEYRGMEFAIGNVFKSCYRLGFKNTRMYELRKMKWFIDREIKLEESKQLEK